MEIIITTISTITISTITTTSNSYYTDMKCLIRNREWYECNGYY